MSDLIVYQLRGLILPIKGTIFLKNFDFFFVTDRKHLLWTFYVPNFR